MAKQTQRVYRMSLSQFHRYLADKRDEAQTFQHEVEEVQERFLEAFRQAMTRWQETFAFCYPRLLAQRAEMPPAFAAAIERVEKEERIRIHQEIEALEAEIKSSQAEADELVQNAQLATQTLKKANPTLNNAEEKLKEHVVQLQDEFADAFEEMERLEAPPLGWLVNWVKIRRLHKVQRMAKKRQSEMLAKIRDVRQSWADRLETTSVKQSELRDKWQENSIRISEAQSRHDHLAANFDALAENAAIQRTLEELDASPGVPGELGERLNEMIERNHVRHAYEQGLSAAAEGVGLSKGVATGMERFAESVAKVVREQRRYNLKKVDIQLSHEIAVLNETWKRTLAAVKDDQALASDPQQFCTIIEQKITAEFTDDAIKGMFETMGQALNHATAQWK